ncbi:MAG TPA: hypothetical protein VK843_02320 [Planctomycetota bacterium]|nr:hypothetical protein [Planctomycetota bacterium]
MELIRKMFEIKSVQLRLLAEIADHREFHRAESPKVMDAVGGGTLMGYDFYFDFVLEQVRHLEPLWKVDSP